MFWEQFYDSMKLFLPKHEKHFFVFTDSYKIKSNNDITVIFQKKLGWPYDTFYRFQMFNTIKSNLLNMDYVYFLNANMRVDKEVNEEIIPTEKNQYLVGVIHPGFKEYEGTFEIDFKSTAFVHESLRRYYYQGCLFGGRNTEFVRMCEVLQNNIDIDAKRNFIAIWHDESHMNYYFSTREILKLHSGYAYPEDLLTSENERIITQLNKHKYGGHDFLRK
jgi:hypothetical protein